MNRLWEVHVGDIQYMIYCKYIEEAERIAQARYLADTGSSAQAYAYPNAEEVVVMRKVPPRYNGRK